MGQRPKDLTPFASPHHYLGDKMRTWRKQRRLSLGWLSNSVRYDPSYMARVERGEQRPSPELVAAYDAALGAGGGLVGLHAEITRGATVADLVSGHVANRGPHVAKDPVALASDGDTQAPSVEGLSVPVRTNDGRIIFVSLSRRALLGALGTGAAVSAAPGLSSATDSPQNAASPLSSPNPIEHLEATRRVLIDNDNLFGPHQAIPIARRQISAIKALRTERRGADRKRLLQLHARYAEMCGWLYQDIGDFRSAQNWMREGLEVSHMAGDPDITAFTLARRSQLAGDMRDPAAVDMAEAAENLATPGSRLAGVAATYIAHGYALRGDSLESQRAYDHAHQIREKMDPDPDSTLGIWLDATYIEVQRAHSLAELGEYSGAANGFRVAIQQLSATYHRDRGVYLARESVAHARAGDAEHAVDVGIQALRIGVETGSDRITRELVQLETELGRWRRIPVVADFYDAMNEAVLRQT